MLSFLFSAAGLVPLGLGWAGLYLVSTELARRNYLGRDWRLSLILASIVWSALAVVIVEACSCVQHLEALWILISWAVVGTVLIAAWMQLRQRREKEPFSFRALTGHLVAKWRLWPKDVQIIIAFLALFVAFLGVLGVVFPTTNWDSMTYQLPRVLYWCDQHSVDHFPTENGRQLESGPWSAFIVTNLYLASGTDLFFNAVQWSSFVLCVITSGWLALKLLNLRAPVPDLDPGLGARVQAFAMLLTATLPGAIVQSLSTQVDLNTAWWVLCFTAMGIALYLEPRNLCYLLGAGLALSLAVLTKATSFIFVGPIGVAGALLVIARQGSLRFSLRLAGVVALCCLVLNAPHAIRNQALYGSPLGSHFMRAIQVDKHVSVGGTVSSLARNIALHSDTGVDGISAHLNQTLKRIHTLAGGPAFEADTSYGVFRCQFNREFPLMDSYAGNFHHLCVILLALGLLLLHPRRNTPLLVYAAPFFLGLFLFCALIRWQPWNARFHLPFFIGLSPVAAVVLSTLLSRWLRGFVLCLLALFGVLCLLANHSCPFLDAGFRNSTRAAQMLRLAPEFYEPTKNAALEIRLAGCQRVGLKLGYDGPEYPLMKMLLDLGYGGQIRHAFSEELSGIFFSGFGFPEELRNPKLRDASGLVNCSWQDPDVLVTWSESALPESVGKKFPTRTVHGLITLYWTDKARAQLPSRNPSE